jgi:hypothetical protein
MLLACGDDADQPELDPVEIGALHCSASELELDLESQTLLGGTQDPGGSGFDLPSGGVYLVSSTYGVPRPGQDGAPISARHQQLMAAILERLSSQPGLLGLQVSSSASCGSGRTLAVWQSEELMYQFVTSPAHLAAMNAVAEILQPGYGVTHWQASSPDQMTLTEAVLKLAEDGTL